MTATLKNHLTTIRHAIDAIDDAIITLLAQRQEEVKKVAHVKKKHQIPVHDAKRELETVVRRKKLSKLLGLDPFRTEVIFEQILNLSRDTQYELKTVDLSSQKTMKVGVMGGIASFSEEAALQFLNKHSVKRFEIFYPITAENVLKDLHKGRVDLAIFPIENSTAGLVMESILALSQYTADIQEIFDFDVRHCLHALPGVKKKDITKIMSHPQALGQCKSYLKHHFPHAQLIEATDTAEGARILEQSPEERHLAVIASKRAGQLYHLETLEQGIQDQKINFTRFIAAKKPA
jgi:chorismate mutase/prephenate dehydratase